ncbi:MAG: aldo/keto reductase family protein [Myxococcota bacterium]|jgi:voltage-dependent potassium channel beta subunit|nr:aldo/keto reductase family protein [Myxococcota bacterium]
MEFRRVGNSGLEVSEISLGSWLTFGSAVDVADSAKVIEAAYELGINFFDTADVYATGAAEEVLGRTLRAIPRHHLVIGTKCFFPMSERPNDHGLSRKHIFESVEGSLSRLQTDYIDLHQCHRPDTDTPVAETVRAYDDLIRAGKVLYWGVSEWSAEQIAEACRVADDLRAPRPISNQPNYSIMRRSIEASVLPESRRLGLGQIVFSPLAQGVLTGKYCGGEMPEGSRATDSKHGRFMGRYLETQELARVERLLPLADGLGISMSQLALAWCLREPGVSSVIVGATNAEQLAENCKAAGQVLPSDVVEQIDETFAPPAAGD